MTADYSNLSVLVVDDQQHVRHWVRGVLANLGIEHVTEASDGRSALKCVREPGAAFDLILCDLRMPGLDGIETIRELSKMGIECAVAIMSVEDERVIETAGALATLQGLRLVGSIPKPLTVEKLEPVLQEVSRALTAQKPVPLEIPESELRDAFARRELLVYYHPKIQMKTGECVGAEAVVRWNHPKRGLLSADVFVQMALSSPEYLAQLTSLTLSEAIAACGRWRSSGRELGVSINLSPLVFDHLDLPEEVESLALAHSVLPGSITLEIPETNLAENTVVLMDIAARLRIKGFRLAVDDFGTGQSALQVLQQIPFNEIKISRSFVDGCADSENKRAVVEASLALAHSLRLSSVAVGIARRPDWNLLAQLGCDIMQGFFIARPMSDDAFDMWVAQWMMHGRGAP